MTLFDLVLRSMRRNVKHYYLYFFALIFSIALYFIFATLRYDPSIFRESGNMAAAFAVAGVLLIAIVGAFVLYANSIFLRRRSREIGLYQLIGLTKGAVARLLIIENALLSIGALVIGIGLGLLVSRVFLLLLLKLIGSVSSVALAFSFVALKQTIVVFLIIIALTVAQILWSVSRSTLLSLFNADQASDHPKQPKPLASALLSTFGALLIAFGYWLSGRMLNQFLVLNMVAVLFMTILGTYFVFRVAIGWVLYRLRQRKRGHLSLADGLSIAPLMHRMKGNANSLTVITVLSAMTITMLASSYSLYYSASAGARLLSPFDFMASDVTPKERADEKAFLAELDKHRISYVRTPIERLQVDAQVPAGLLPDLLSGGGKFETKAQLVSADALRKAGVDTELSDPNSAHWYAAQLYWALKSVQTPTELTLAARIRLPVEKIAEGNALNPSARSLDTQLVVSAAVYEKIKGQLLLSGQAKPAVFYAIQIQDETRLPEASALFKKGRYDFAGADFYSSYQSSLQVSGVLIFIAGFLGLAFLIATGSILYFKQMTEAEQEKRGYATLRQLGFSVPDLMRGIARKQLLVFGLPLLIGLLHSAFAIRSASFLFTTDVTVPVLIATSAYALIYVGFAILTIGYYRKIVRAAL